MASREYLDLHFKDSNVDALKQILEDRDGWWTEKRAVKYKEVLSNLEPVDQKKYKTQNGIVSINHELNESQLQAAKDLCPWKKGPYALGDTFIDSEWKGDLKWDRVCQELPDLKNKKILDIGCANGYFLFRMAEHNPKLVLGIDPVLHPAAQFKYIQHFTQDERIKFELLGVAEVPLFKNAFDVIFSMGILYHHKNPIEQLFQTKDALVAGGTLVLETIGIPGEDNISLTPEDRYAKMRNVWQLPTLPCLLTWLERAKFKNVRVVSKEWGQTDEQRVTPWSGEVSLEDFLDPHDKTKTVEGLPAPRRFLVLADKK